MNEQSFADQVSSALDRVNALRARAAEEGSSELMAEALEELGTAFEELRVAQEELRVQNEALAAAEAIAVTERDRFRDLFEFAPNGYLVSDAEGVIRESNRAARELLSIPGPRYVTGKPLTVFVAPEDRGRYLNQLSGLRRGEPVWEQTLRMQPRPEGTAEPKVVELTVVPFRDPETREPLLRWQLRDVTEQWKATEALRKWNEDLEARVKARTAELEKALAEKEAAERRLAFLCESGALLASSLDFTATLAHISKRAVPTLGDACLLSVVGADGRMARFPMSPLSKAQRAALRAWEEAHPDRTPDDLPDRVLAVDDTAAPPGGLPRAEAAVSELFAALGWGSALWLPLAADGEVLGGLAIGAARPGVGGPAELAFAEQFARQVAVALRNADLVRRLQAADEARDSSIAALVHELRNPLTPLGYAAHILGSKVSPDSELGRPVAVIQRQVQQLARLVDDVLDVSRIAQDKVQLHPEAVDVVAAARASIEEVRERAAARGVHLAAALPADPLWVQADPARLKQVLANLLANAVKYTDAGGSVRVEAARDGKEAVVRVCDTGIGIAPELLPRVFDLYAQGARSLERSQGGLGIGLHLVKRLVELHGGSVSAASAGPGQGSEFTVRLPA